MTPPEPILNLLVSTGRGLPELRSQVGPGHPLASMFAGDDDFALCVLCLRPELVSRKDSVPAPTMLAASMRATSCAFDQDNLMWDDELMIRQMTAAAMALLSFDPAEVKPAHANRPHLSLVAGARGIAFCLLRRVDPSAKTAISLVFDLTHEMNAQLAHLMGGTANVKTKML